MWEKEAKGWKSIHDAIRGLSRDLDITTTFNLFFRAGKRDQKYRVAKVR